jgi:hypothetical protein
MDGTLSFGDGQRTAHHRPAKLFPTIILHGNLEAHFYQIFAAALPTLIDH